MLWTEIRKWAKDRGYTTIKDKDDGKYYWSKLDDNNPDASGVAHSVSKLATAIFNQALAYKELNLSLVIGSFGVGKGQNPLFLFGDRNYKRVKEFVTDNGDFHAWLEDSEQRVYDIYYPHYYIDAFDRHPSPPSYQVKTVIEGKSKPLRNRLRR